MKWIQDKSNRVICLLMVVMMINFLFELLVSEWVASDRDLVLGVMLSSLFVYGVILGASLWFRSLKYFMLVLGMVFFFLLMWYGTLDWHIRYHNLIGTHKVPPSM